MNKIMYCSIIVEDYKTGLNNFDLDSFRELILEAKKRGMTSTDLASLFRLYNFFLVRGQRKMRLSLLLHIRLRSL
jgi:hypothetical protein